SLTIPELTTRHSHTAIADILKCPRPILRQLSRPALTSVKGEALIPSASVTYRELGQPTLRQINFQDDRMISGLSPLTAPKPRPWSKRGAHRRPVATRRQGL